MAVFEYKALDAGGQSKKGFIESDTPRQARQLLRDQRLSPLSVSESGQRSERQGTRPSRRKISSKDLSLITRQLATLSHSGLPVEESLQVISRQTEKNRIRHIILDLRAAVLEGQSLAQACDKHPAVFTPLYRATVSAGESSGKLGAVMERLADHLEKRDQMRQKLQLAMIYPVLLSVISLLVVVGLLIFVIPEIVGVFDNLGQELPALTQGLISLSLFIKRYGIFLVALLLAIWLTFRLMLKIEPFRKGIDRLLLTLPLYGRFTRNANAASFARTLAILTDSGVELLESLGIAAKIIPNTAMRDAVSRAAVGVREGGSLSNALAQSKLFPPITLHLIASGETSGQLAKMLKSAADNQEQEVQSTAEMTVGIFEPALILVMGGVVLTIVIAILLPIFEMNQLVGS